MQESCPPIGLSRGLLILLFIRLGPREGFPSRGIWSLGAMVSGPGQGQEFQRRRRDGTFSKSRSSEENNTMLVFQEKVFLS